MRTSKTDSTGPAGRVKIAHVDKLLLGERLARAREAAGVTQEGLGRAVNLDRTAISRLEAGDRKLSVTELVSIAEALHRPLSYFVAPPVPAAVSRRSQPEQVHESTQALDIELETFAADVRTLLEMGIVTPVTRPEPNRTLVDHSATETLAQDCRRSLGLGNGPVADLGFACEQLGLYSFAAPLAASGPDGACVEVDSGRAVVAAAVINGDAPAGRRRMTLAHELGHWLSGDAYDRSASDEIEKMLSSFAIHFLAPRAGVQAVWDRSPDWKVRDRALSVAASFRLSWSAAVGQLRNLELVSSRERAELVKDEPRAGDYKRLGLSWNDELEAPYVSPGFTAACLNGYIFGHLTQSRCLELLRNTMVEADLPRPRPMTMDDLRTSFAAHGH